MSSASSSAEAAPVVAAAAAASRPRPSCYGSIIMPTPPQSGDIKRWWPSSVCPSVCPVPDPTSRMEKA